MPKPADQIKNKSGSRNTSINLEIEVLEWLDEQSDNRGINRSKLINDIIKERMTVTPSGFKADVEWFLENNYAINAFKITDLAWKQHPVKGDKPSFDTVHKLVNERYDRPGKNNEEVICYIIPAESIRENVKDLFANAVIFNVENERPVILLIPYKLTPKHKIWKAFEQYPNIHIATPETLMSTIGKIEERWVNEVRSHAVDWHSLFQEKDYDELLDLWGRHGDTLTLDDYEEYRTFAEQGQEHNIPVINEGLLKTLKAWGYHMESDSPF